MPNIMDFIQQSEKSRKQKYAQETAGLQSMIDIMLQQKIAQEQKQEQRSYAEGQYQQRLAESRSYSEKQKQEQRSYAEDQYQRKLQQKADIEAQKVLEERKQALQRHQDIQNEYSEYIKGEGAEDKFGDHLFRKGVIKGTERKYYNESYKDDSKIRENINNLLENLPADIKTESEALYYMANQGIPLDDEFAQLAIKARFEPSQEEKTQMKLREQSLSRFSKYKDDRQIEALDYLTSQQAYAENKDKLDSIVLDDTMGYQQKKNALTDALGYIEIDGIPLSNKQRENIVNRVMTDKGVTPLSSAEESSLKGYNKLKSQIKDNTYSKDELTEEYGYSSIYPMKAQQSLRDVRNAQIKEQGTSDVKRIKDSLSQAQINELKKLGNDKLAPYGLNEELLKYPEDVFIPQDFINELENRGLIKTSDSQDWSQRGI